jgi:Cupin
MARPLLSTEITVAKTETVPPDGLTETGITNDNNPSAVANDNNPPVPAYLLELSARSREAGHLFKFDQICRSLALINGTGIYVPDALKRPHITNSDIYLGVATPRAMEKPHWHFRGWEVYLALEGEAEMLVKWHEEVDWKRRLLRPRDWIVIQPGCCHWLRWHTNHGLVLVVKAPTIPGIGKPPNGKQMCTNGCHLYKNGCVLPDGYNPD